MFDLFLTYLNFLIHKFTYDKYQYHTRVICKLCVTLTDPAGHVHTNCDHTAKAITSNLEASNTEDFEDYMHGGHLNTGKMCARHRLPSTGSVSSYGHYNNARRYRRALSFASNTDNMSLPTASERDAFSGVKKRLKIRKRNNVAKFDFDIEAQPVNKLIEVAGRSNSSLGLNKIDVDSIIRRQLNEDSVNRVRRLSTSKPKVGQLRRSDSSKKSLNKLELEQPGEAEAATDYQTRSRKSSRSRVHFSLGSDDESKNAKQIKDAPTGNLPKYVLLFRISSLLILNFLSRSFIQQDNCLKEYILCFESNR